MTFSIPLTLAMATCAVPSDADAPGHPDRTLDDLCATSRDQLQALVNAFLSEPITPARTQQFEHDIQLALRALGRVVVHYSYNRVEPAAVANQPRHAHFERERYTRVRGKTPQHVWTVFGNWSSGGSATGRPRRASRCSSRGPTGSG
ncbi:hypothetical protein [Fimbriiglobus ruber]|uniref:Uncharacterized protein n=1 Tax=Fimbriiglobus ruber TaxID=1908690 RepID=A0A225DME8_9BACT|nr:hypothetical protein [Fimbriiglobus ruber]OWK37595.1 hypothetical protein FRUB_06715 [Fimbriiglobus ruber]